MLYEGFLQTVNPKDDSGRRQPVQIKHSMLGGAFAGVGMWTSSFPFDTIKSKMQSDSLENPKFKGMRHAFQLTYSELGIKGFYRGFGPCMARALPVNMALFTGYETTMKILRKFA